MQATQEQMKKQHNEEQEVYRKQIKDLSSQIVTEQKKRLLLNATMSEQKSSFEKESKAKITSMEIQMNQMQMELNVEKKISNDLKSEANRLWKQVKQERKINQELQGGIRMIEQENHKIRSRLGSHLSLVELNGQDEVNKVEGLTCQLETLSCENIVTLLHNCGYGDLVGKFRSANIDGSALSDITQQDLEQIGMDPDSSIQMMEKIIALKILGVPLQSFIERNDKGCLLM